jgi:hypothetical protein
MSCILQINNVVVVIDSACGMLFGTCTSAIDNDLTQRSSKGRRKGKDTIRWGIWQGKKRFLKLLSPARGKI